MFITQYKVLYSEPAGGPLELSEGAITEIPCTGGQGSFEVSVSGGSSELVAQHINYVVGPEIILLKTQV